MTRRSKWILFRGVFSASGVLFQGKLANESNENGIGLL